MGTQMTTTIAPSKIAPAVGKSISNFVKPGMHYNKV